MKRRELRGNPFVADVYPDGYAAGVVFSGGHGVAWERLQGMVGAAGRRRQGMGVGSEGGEAVLLGAVRAGYGKSHLLAAVREALGGEALVAAVGPEAVGGMEWVGLLWQVLGGWHEEVSGGVSRLEMVARRLFGYVNEGLIREGVVPCAGVEAAVEMLRERAGEVFVFGERAGPVARWWEGNFERLVVPGARLLAAGAGVGEGAAAHWLRVLMGYCQGAGDGEMVRWEGMRWAVREPVGGGGGQVVEVAGKGGSWARERLVEVCRLVAVVRPVVFVCDDIDRLHGKQEEIVATAACLSELRRLVARSVTVLSVNDDLWERNFRVYLPGALEDRLTGRRIRLGGMSEGEARTLLRRRMEQGGEEEERIRDFLRQVPLGMLFERESAVSPRAVLRMAAEVWETWVPGVEGGVAAVREFPVMPVIGAEREGVSAFSGGDEAVRESFLIVPEDEEMEECVVSVEGAEVVAAADEGGGTVERRWQRRRAVLLAGGGVRADDDAVFQVLKTAGQQLAVVTWEEGQLPGGGGRRVGVWRMPGAEIWLGMEPHGDSGYWQTLVRFVHERRMAVRETVRLAVFSEAARPVPLHTWVRPDEIIGARVQFLDVHTLDEGELAGLAAAGELLREAERGGGVAGPAEVFGVLAERLAFLWRELTRLPERA
jgi:hypothetical protein